MSDNRRGRVAPAYQHPDLSDGQKEQEPQPDDRDHGAGWLAGQDSPRDAGHVSFFTGRE